MIHPAKYCVDKGPRLSCHRSWDLCIIPYGKASSGHWFVGLSAAGYLPLIPSNQSQREMYAVLRKAPIVIDVV